MLEMGEGCSGVFYSQLKAYTQQRTEKCGVDGSLIVVAKDVAHRLERFPVMAQGKLVFAGRAVGLRRLRRHRGRRAVAAAGAGAVVAAGIPVDGRRAQGGKGDDGVAQRNLLVDGLQNQALPGGRADVADDAVDELVAKQVEVGNLLGRQPARLRRAKVRQREGRGKGQAAVLVGGLGDAIAAAARLGAVVADGRRFVAANLADSVWFLAATQKC